MQAAATHSRAIQLDPPDNVLIALMDLKQRGGVEHVDNELRVQAGGRERVKVDRRVQPVSGDLTKAEFSSQDNFVPCSLPMKQAQL